MKKDNTIQITRVLAMLFIIICHLFQELNNNYFSNLAQFFNVGVFIFIFLSGFLYGNKKIDNSIKWIIKRYKRINIPIIITILILIVINKLDLVVSVKTMAIYLSCTQYFLGSVKGAAHLWFISIIMICYLFTPLLSCIKKNKLKYLIIVLLFLGCFFSYVNSKLGMIFFYLDTYLIGYFIKYKKINFKIYIPVICLIFSIIARILGHHFLDNTILYSCIIFSISEILFSISFYFILSIFLEKKQNKNNSLIDYFDNLSYYIYITHYTFFVGPLRTMNLFNSVTINILITLLCSYISAVILSVLDKRIIKFFIKD